MRRKVLMAATGAMLSIAAACGGSGSPDSADEAGSDGGGGGVVSTVGDVPGVSEACEDAVNLIGAVGQIMAGQIAAEDARATIDQFVENVPSELEADAAVFAEAYLAWVDVLATYDNDITAAYADPEAQAALERLSAVETSGAFERINAYVSEECDYLG
jgi:hypothetical protein